MTACAPSHTLAAARVWDIPFIMALEREPASRRFVVQGSAFSHVREIVSPAYRLFVVRKDGERAGFCLCRIDRDNRSFEIRRVVAKKKGGGMVSEVFPALFRYAFSRLSLHRVWLDVYADNPRAAALYERLGMTEDGMLRQSHRDADGGYRSQHIYSLLRTDAAGRVYEV